MGTLKQSWENAFSKIRNNKALEYGLYALIVVLIVWIYFFSQAPSEKAEAREPSASANVEDRLRQTLCKIEGAGEVQVMITYQTSSEIVPALSVDTQTTYDDGITKSQNSKTAPITLNQSGWSSTMVLKEILPEIKGVIIVAQGAGDIAVRMNLLRAAQTVLDIPSSKVDVFQGKSAENK